MSDQKNKVWLALMAVFEWPILKPPTTCGSCVLEVCAADGPQRFPLRGLLTTFFSWVSTVLSVSSHIRNYRFLSLWDHYLAPKTKGPLTVLPAISKTSMRSPGSKITTSNNNNNGFWHQGTESEKLTFFSILSNSGLNKMYQGLQR
jgi:hypothetical protein